MDARSARGRLRPVGPFWLAAALVAIPPVYTAPIGALVSLGWLVAVAATVAVVRAGGS